MSPQRSLILCHAESLVHARPGDLVVTDVSEVFEAATSKGIACTDLREVLRGSETYVDEIVNSWRSFIDSLESPEAAGVPLLGCLRAELLWEVLFPFARYAVATSELSQSTPHIATDARPGGPRRAAIESILGDGGVLELPGVPAPLGEKSRLKRDPLLPPSHGPVTFHPAPPRSLRALGKYAALQTLGRAASLLGAGRTAKSKRPAIVYAHYHTLGGIGRELGRRYRVVAWPWCYPGGRDLPALAAGGVVTIPVPQAGTALREVLPQPARSTNPGAVLEEEVRASIPDRSFSIDDFDLTGALAGQISQTAAKYLMPLATRIASARAAVAGMGARCIVIPNDTSLDCAVLARVGAAHNLPVVVVAHGLEGSRVLGDKRLASDVFAWSGPMAEDLRRSLMDTGAKVWAPGPPYLEHLSRRKSPAHGSVLFLSYTVRHNTAWDSWMDAERYLRLVSETIHRLGDGVRVVGLKIHPSEDAAYYKSAMKRVHLEVPLLDRGWVYQNLDDAGVVVGPFSTGLAEAYYFGSIPICVNLSGGALPAPCDGSTEIPIVTEADSLVRLLSEWLGGGVWSGWTPGDWLGFGDFVGSPDGADVRAAELLEKVIA